MNNNGSKLVSVIIPTKNPKKEMLMKCLNSIFSQTYSNFEIIIVDGSIKKPEIFKDIKDIRYIKQKHKHVSGARQDGLDAAKGKYVVGLDSDCIAEPDWIEKIINTFDEKNMEVFVIGRSLSMTESLVETNLQKEYDNWINHVTCNLNQKRFSITIDSKNYGFVTEYGKKIGFDESLVSGEDFDFATRARRKGHKILYNPDAIIHHFHKPRIRELIHQKIWHGKGYGQNMVKNNIDFEHHFQMLNMTLLIGSLLLFPLLVPLIFSVLLKMKIKNKIQFIFNQIFYWSFIYGTIKGMYSKGHIKFLFLKMRSDLLNEISHNPQIFYI
jgi:glycosyltransferase involved in cell wall biosynthesis